MSLQFDAVAANGGVWFYVPPMITFFILLTEIVMEKVELCKCINFVFLNDSNRKCV